MKALLAALMIVACLTTHATAGDCHVRHRSRHRSDFAHTGFVTATIGGVPGLLEVHSSKFRAFAAYTVPTAYPVAPFSAYSSYYPPAFSTLQPYPYGGQPQQPAQQQQAAQPSRWLEKPEGDAMLGHVILTETCTKCHNPQKKSGGLSFYEGGQWNVNWQSVYARVVDPDPSRRMPPGGKWLDQEAIEILDRLASGGQEPQQLATPADCDQELIDALADAVLAAVLERLKHGPAEQQQHPSGAEVFNSRCASCHDGQGEGENEGPAFVGADGNPLPDFPLADIYGAARFGSMPKPPATALTDDEFLALRSWLETLGLPKIGEPPFAE